MSGGQIGSAIVFPRPERRRPPARPAQPGFFGLVFAHPGTHGDRALHRERRQGPVKAAIRNPNPVMFLENEILYGQSFPVPKLDDFVLPIGRRGSRGSAATSPSCRSPWA